MFEVWEINANGINSQTPKLQTALARVLDKLERNQKKGKSSTYNFQDDGHISSCPVVHVSYRKPVIWPKNMPKTADWGKKRSKLWYLKMGPLVQPKCFRHLKHMRNNWELRKRGYLIRFGHTEALLLKKKDIKRPFFPPCRNWPIWELSLSS